MVPFRPNLVKVVALLIALAWFTTGAADAAPSVESKTLSAWFAAQSTIRTWTADFIQTRTFKSLAQPLTATGRVYFAEPNRFRWELGQPPRTIAVRTTNDLLVIYPNLKRVERYPLVGGQMGEWRDALALLETGFPRTEAEMRARFKILSQLTTNDVSELTLQPLSASARRMMPRIQLSFQLKDFSLRATELQFADGSSMRNDFTNSVLNPEIDLQLFAPQIDPEYKVVEPLRK
jgi:outer membrane lipoprotein-sorting protein